MDHQTHSGFQHSSSLKVKFYNIGFNTALLQTYARKTQTAIDQLTFRTHVQNKTKEDIQNIPENGFNIYGLYLQGASWSWTKNNLIEAKLGELWHEMPVIW
jgi:dynein heavy chain